MKSSSPETIRLLVTVKAYPTPSVKYHEAVCVAGIRTDTAEPQWVRLYPVNFRDLDDSQQFKKYDEIEVEVSPGSDGRPESVKPVTSTIRIVRKVMGKEWRDRRLYVEPLIVESMCFVQQRQKDTGLSLGAFRPHEVTDVVAEAESEEWSQKELDALSQMTLFAPNKKVLEKIPWRWRMKYSCGGKTCNGHSQTIVDWEIAEAWRKWSRSYGPDDTVERIRRKWLDELCGPTKDTVFFVGNQHQHPVSFLVLGVFWPPRKQSTDGNDVQLGLDL